MATRKKPARAAKTGDQHAAEDLILFIDNESDLSLQGPSGQGRSVALNAMRRFRKGTYNPELAVKLFGYLVESGAKQYAKEHGSRPWNEMFDVATRRLAAEQLEEDFRRMAKGGELDHLDGVREGSRMNASGRAKPWRTNPLLPGVDQLATAVARLSRNLERSADGEIELRLQVFPDGGWELHYGDSGWDPDHSGSWGASSIPGGTIPFDEAHRIADDLLQQVDDQMSEDIEEKPKRTLPLGRNLRASQGIVRSKGKR